MTLYALLERNEAVLDLSASFLATTVIGLAVTRICNAVFLKHHPDYRHKMCIRDSIRPMQRITATNARNAAEAGAYALAQAF